MLNPKEKIKFRTELKNNHLEFLKEVVSTYSRRTEIQFK